MADDSADEVLSSEELEEVFDRQPRSRPAPVVEPSSPLPHDLPTELEEPPDDPEAPIDALESLDELENEPLEPLPDRPTHRVAASPSHPRKGETQGLTRAVWFFGAIVTLLLGVQTAQLVFSHDDTARAVQADPTPAPSPSQVAAPAASDPEAMDRLLRTMRVRLSRSLYQDVIRTLEPKVDDPALLDRDQRFEAFLLLAKAYRALENVEKAQEYMLRATDQAVERRAPAQVVEYASTLQSLGRHAEARTELMKLLARRDAFTSADEPFLMLAEARVADAWYAQAKQSGHLAPFPDSQRKGAGR